MAKKIQSNIALEATNSPVIVLTGGGSGGHITPLLAVADELKKLCPNVRLVYIGQKGDRLNDLPVKHGGIDKVYNVRAGKFRRYHGVGPMQLLDVWTVLKNIRDFFYVIVGICQCVVLLKRLKPRAILIKGGYVGVPVGLAAAVLRISYVTHDSDALPGLANRIIGHWASAHAVALPKNIYKYPADKTFTVGVPISPKFRAVTKRMQAAYKKDIGLEPTARVLFITGGGKGALRLNEAVASISPFLLANNPKLRIVHATGHDHERDIIAKYDNLLKGEQRDRVKVKDFFEDDFYVNSGAADIIVARAGATNLAEFAAQNRCCIIVPNPQLTGGHQLENANYLARQKAVAIADDEVISTNPETLQRLIQDLLNNAGKRHQLAVRLGHFARPRATKELAELILDEVY